MSKRLYCDYCSKGFDTEPHTIDGLKMKFCSEVCKHDTQNLLDKANPKDSVTSKQKVETPKQEAIRILKNLIDGDSEDQLGKDLTKVLVYVESSVKFVDL